MRQRGPSEARGKQEGKEEVGRHGYARTLYPWHSLYGDPLVVVNSLVALILRGREYNMRSLHIRP